MFLANPSLSTSTSSGSGGTQVVLPSLIFGKNLLHLLYPLFLIISGADSSTYDPSFSNFSKQRGTEEDTADVILMMRYTLPQWKKQ